MADPMTSARLEEFAANAPEVELGELWSLLDWSFWGAGMADTFREPLANTMLAAIPADVRAQAEAIMADFIRRREIEKTGVTIYQEQAAEVERLRLELQAFKPQPMSKLCRDGRHNGTGDWTCVGCHCLCHSQDTEVERLRKERDGLREQLHRVKTVRVWTNEDGKKFVFVDDLVAAVDGGESR